MKVSPYGHIKSHFILVIFCLLVTALPLHAEVSRFDMVIRVNDFFSTLDEIDNMMSSVPGGQPVSLRAMVESGQTGLPLNADWIDDTRAVVVGITMVEQAPPEMHILLPFSEANEAFESKYPHVKSGKNYIMKFGNQKVELTRSARKILEKASVSDTRGAISVTMAVGSILDENEDKILDAMDQIEAGADMQDREEMQPMTPGELKEMMGKMLNMARQMEEYTFGLDFGALELVIYNDITAESGSDLASFLEQGNIDKSRLSEYSPDLPIRFRVGAVDSGQMMELLNDMFGTLYKKIGIDLAEFADIMGHFTGEMAGGMSFSKDGMRIESIQVLKEESEDFLEKTYIPWILKYGEEMEQVLGGTPEAAAMPTYKKTKASVVAGVPVSGIKISFPSEKKGKLDAETERFMQMMTYEMRMAVVKDILLVAPDDDRMKEMIMVAGKLKEQKHLGPMASMEIDPGALISTMLPMMPEITRENLPEFPETEKMIFEMNAKGRTLLTKAVINLDDMEEIAAFFEEIEGTPFGSRADDSRPKKKQPRKQQVKKTKPARETPELETSYDAEKDPRYWYDKGGLAATYGNERAAVKHYQKALKLAPGNPEILFQLGVTHGELGNSTQALSYINQALAKRPENGDFLYARGRIYLLAGDMEKAMADFIGAAGHGNADAQRYLDRH